MQLDQRKTFSRFKLCSMLESLFGEILWFDRQFVSALEDLSGGQTKIKSLVRILSILGIEEKWAQANEQMQNRTEPTCIQSGLTHLQSRLTTLFYVSPKETEDRANDTISNRTRKKALKSVDITRPPTPPSEQRIDYLQFYHFFIILCWFL